MLFINLWEHESSIRVLNMQAICHGDRMLDDYFSCRWNVSVSREIVGFEPRTNIYGVW